MFDVRFDKLMEKIINLSFQVLIDDLLFNFQMLQFADFCIIFCPSVRTVGEASTNGE